MRYSDIIIEATQLAEIRMQELDYDPYQEMTWDHYQNSVGKKLGKINEYSILQFDNDQRLHIFLVNNDDAVAELVLEKFREGSKYDEDDDYLEGYQVNMVVSKIRGGGLIPQLYIFLAKNGMAICSDIAQTKAAKIMWDRIRQIAPSHGLEVDAVGTSYNSGKQSPIKNKNPVTSSGEKIYNNRADWGLRLAKK